MACSPLPSIPFAIRIPTHQKLPQDSYMYETFAAVMVGTCGFLGYLLLSQERGVGKKFKHEDKPRRSKWASTVDGEPELEELCDELMEVE